MERKGRDEGREGSGEEGGREEEEKEVGRKQAMGDYNTKGGGER